MADDSDARGNFKVNGAIGSAMQGLVSKWLPVAGQIDNYAASMARSIGLGTLGLERSRTVAIGLVSQFKLAADYGLDAATLLEQQATLSETIKRNFSFTADNVREFAAMLDVLGTEGTTKLVDTFDDIGLGVNAAAEYTETLWKTASQSGLNFKEYSKTVTDNLLLAQKYQFRDGLNGLARMAEKANSIKMSLGQASGLAEKMLSSDNQFEASIEIASKLQVLGGSFAAYGGNPLAMLNESLTDMEGLQDRMQNMIKGVGEFNRQTGRVELTPFDQMELRQYAGAVGVNYDELIRNVNMQAKRTEIEGQLGNRGGALREKIINQAQFENGRAGVSIGGNFIELEELLSNPQLQEQFKQENTTEEESLLDISKHVQSLDSKIGRAGAQISNEQALYESQAIPLLKKWTEDKITNMPIEMYRALGLGSLAANAVENVSKTILAPIKNGVEDVLKAFTHRDGGYLPKKEFGGGIAVGPTHEDGGILASINHKPVAEIEGGEFVVNRKATEKYGDLISAINNSTINNSSFSTSENKTYFADGGSGIGKRALETFATIDITNFEPLFNGIEKISAYVDGNLITTIVPNIVNAIKEISATSPVSEKTIETKTTTNNTVDNNTTKTTEKQFSDINVKFDDINGKIDLKFDNSTFDFTRLSQKQKDEMVNEIKKMLQTADNKTTSI